MSERREIGRRGLLAALGAGFAALLRFGRVRRARAVGDDPGPKNEPHGEQKRPRTPWIGHY